MMILILIVAILLLDQSVAFIFPNLLRNCARLHSNRQEASTSLDAPISSSSSLSSVTGARDKGMSAINRADFPILDQDAYEGKPLIYLDSAASSQKPTSVINAMNEYYLTTHSNVHRGAHALASRATTQYEWAREQLQSFINAKHREEVIFVRGKHYYHYSLIMIVIIMMIVLIESLLSPLSIYIYLSPSLFFLACLFLYHHPTTISLQAPLRQSI